MGGDYTTTRDPEAFYDGEVLADQAGDGAGNGTKTFVFSVPVDLVWVRCKDGEGRAVTQEMDVTPTAVLGVRCPADEPVPITQRTSQVIIFLPAGVSANVYGYRWRASGALPVP